VVVRVQEVHQASVGSRPAACHLVVGVGAGVVRGRGRAVVLGGSLAGLLTAAALAGRFTEVTIVDRDRLEGRLKAPRRSAGVGG